MRPDRIRKRRFEPHPGAAGRPEEKNRAGPGVAPGVGAGAGPEGVGAAAEPSAENARHAQNARHARDLWDEARRALDGLPGGAGLNMAHEAVMRHAAGPARDRVALRCIGTDGGVRELSYARLAATTARLAHALRGLGVEPGARVFALAGRVPELVATALAALSVRAVFCPLFSAYGPEPIRARLDLGEARVLLTTPRLYPKVADLRRDLPALEHVITTGGETPAGARAWDDLLAGAAERFVVPPTSPEDLALLHFTSGTTGTPKGVLHAHEALVAQHATARSVLDLRPGDLYWCTADPGWVTGTVYGVVAPLAAGASVLLDEGEFDATRWLDLLEGERVQVWYTAPTAVRLLMRLDRDAVRSRDTGALRHLASVGEPLHAEAVWWSQEVFGRPFHDTWWQTETGAIVVANRPDLDVKPGSMGRPVPGIEAEVAEVPEHGAPRPRPRGETGELVLRAGWPSMFRGYAGDPERTRRAFADGWYRSGDLAREDADGYLWFVGRADDVIKTAGHLVGPAEVESVLLEHPALVEAGVIGVPDAVAGEVVKAFAVARPERAGDPGLAREILAHARRRLGAALAPKQIELRDRLPKTRSGKIARRVLRARERGEPAGDLSALQDAD